MKIVRLAFLNFKNSFKSYLSLVLSLAFTILVFFNFQNIIHSDAFAILGQRNKDYIDTLIQICLTVLLCFLFFFLWYATNVFLTRRKREIGIYIFMGMSNRKIGSLYLVEISFVGATALVMGIVFGALFAGLFQMIMGAVSDITVDVRFGISIQAIKMTSVSFLSMYLFFALKGFWNITHSSVLNMISAAKQNEYLHVKPVVLLLKAALGAIVLASGYYYANKGGRNDTLTNALLAVVLVIIGVYLLFGGLIPLVFQMLAACKGFLYRGQRCLWVNQTIFRMRKKLPHICNGVHYGYLLCHCTGNRFCDERPLRQHGCIQSSVYLSVYQQPKQYRKNHPNAARRKKPDYLSKRALRTFT